MSRKLEEEIFDWAGLVVQQLIVTRWGHETTVLDVGAGQGKYRYLLPSYPNVDAVEIWAPYVARWNLTELYRHVYVGDVAELVGHETWEHLAYDVAIFGDVLEHLEVDVAQRVLERVVERVADVIIVVPYRYPQEPDDDNEHQRHVQDDLTPELMTERYAELRLVALETRGGEPFKGVYRGSRE